MADDQSTTHNTLGPFLSGFGQFFTQLLQFVIVEEPAGGAGGGDCRPSLSKSPESSGRLNTGQEKCTRPRESDNLLLLGSELSVEAVLGLAKRKTDMCYIVRNLSQRYSPFSSLHDYQL